MRVRSNSRRHPALGQGAVVQQDSKALGVECIGLVGLAHALLGFGGVGEMWAVTGLLHLVDHSVPMPSRFKGDLAVGRGSMEEVDVLLPVMTEPDWRGCLALAVNGHEDRELLVCVASDRCWHGALL